MKNSAALYTTAQPFLEQLSSGAANSVALDMCRTINIQGKMACVWQWSILVGGGILLTRTNYGPASLHKHISREEWGGKTRETAGV